MCNTLMNYAVFFIFVNKDDFLLTSSRKRATCSVKCAQVKCNPYHDFLFHFKLYNDIKKVVVCISMDGLKKARF